MLIAGIFLIILILSVISIVVTIGGSRNQHEREISDKAQIEFCRKISSENAVDESKK